MYELSTVLINMHYYDVVIFSILLENVFYSSDALILIKFGRGPRHYMKNAEEGSTVHDPLDDFELQSRILLCDAVLNAKQFVFKNPPSYMKRRPQEPMIQLTKWSIPADAAKTVLNYQRSISSVRGGDDSPVLQYYARSVRMGDNVHKTMKRLQCVRTGTINWFVTFGLVDKFMYLLELSEEKVNLKLRLVGIFEPSALLDDRGFWYFESQLRKYRDEMESICLLGDDDRLRLCSAIFDTLSMVPGSLSRDVGQFNYVKNERRYCVLRDILIGDRIFQPYFLRCQTVHKDKRDKDSSLLFYALADSGERGAAFVFFEERRGGRLRLHTRVVKIGALMNPVSEREVQLNADANPTYPEKRKGKGKIDDKFVSFRKREEIRNKRKREKHAARARLNQKKSKKKMTRQPTSVDELWEEEQDETSEEEYVSLSDDGEYENFPRRKFENRLKVTEIDDRSTMSSPRELGENVSDRPLEESSEREGDVLREGNDQNEEDTWTLAEFKNRRDRKTTDEGKNVSDSVHTGEEDVSTHPTNVPARWGRQAKRSQCTYEDW